MGYECRPPEYVPNRTTVDRYEWIDNGQFLEIGERSLLSVQFACY